MTNEEVAQLRRVCPRLFVEHVEDAGHLVARDSPIKLADILLKFEQSAPVRKETRRKADRKSLSETQ